MPLRGVEPGQHRVALGTLHTRLVRVGRARRRHVPLRILHSRESLGAELARRPLHAPGGARTSIAGTSSLLRGCGRDLVRVDGGIVGVVAGVFGVRERDRETGGGRGRRGDGSSMLGRTDV